jgi:DNA repair ATPase RecN
MIQSFKNFQADRMDIDDLIELAAFGHQLRETYEKYNLDVPEFVGTQLNALRREIRSKTAESLAARRKEVKARLDALKTPSERKTELTRELKKLDEQLETEVTA